MGTFNDSDIEAIREALEAMADAIRDEQKERFHQ